MNPHIEELESLLFDWESGAMESDGVERVRRILRTDEDARQWFVQQQMMTAALTLEGDVGLLASDANISAESELAGARRVTAKRRLPRVSSWAFAAAAILICIQAGRILYLEKERDGGQESIAERTTTDRKQTKEATSRGIALVTRLVDVEWDADQAPLEVGDALSPGRLAINSGYAQVEFFCGATVVLEGPAELDLKSETLARVRRGRLRAQVPPAARGFSLEVDDMKVVDLGTEFGLSVSPEAADVQVFEGEVELHHAETRHNLLTGQAVTRMSSGEMRTGTVTPDQYLDIATLESRDRGQTIARFERWKSWSQQARRDERLIAYYAFDRQGGWQRRLGSSLEPANSELDGAIVGSSRVSGRWPSKRGLEFKHPADRVRVRIPGEYGSLTLACWVKIDSLDRQYNSLFLTDNYNQGEPHWQILETGQLFFSVRAKPDNAVGVIARGRTHHEVLSPPFWKPSLSGRWLHLATTYDVAGSQTIHYLNGEVLHAEAIPEALLVKTTRIGPATIGNWSSPTRPNAEFAIRNLNGSIDEFALFSTALSGEEIKEIYENGRP